MSEIFQPFYLATFSFLFFISLIIHFLFRIILRRLKVVDVPDGEKKIHRMLVPISGGISIMFSLVVIGALYLALSYSQFLEIFFETESLKLSTWNLDFKTGILFGITSLIVAAVSFFDDVLELPVWFRFMTLVLCSGMVIGVSGLSLTSLGNLFGFGEIKLNTILSPIFTIFCVVGVANAFNWIDGLDGLFSTQVLIVSSAIFYFIGGNGIFFTIFLIAFLPYLLMNLSFFGKKNRVFMGDHGSMAIGYTAAWFLISAAEFEVINPMTAPWLIAMVLLNALRVMFKRVLLRVSIFRSDREHIHHFFLDNGFSKGQSLLIVTLISISLTLIGVIFEINEIAEYVSFYAFLSAFIIWSILSSNLKKRFEN